MVIRMAMVALLLSAMPVVGQRPEKIRLRVAGAQIPGAIFKDAILANAAWVDRRRCKPASVGVCE